MEKPIVNAMAIGKDKPFIVVTTGLVNLHDEEELRWVIGHELGHILSGHAVYRTMLLFLIQLIAADRLDADRVPGPAGDHLGPRGVVPQVRAVLRPGRACSRARTWTRRGAH